MIRNAPLVVALLVVAMVSTPVQKLSALPPDSQSSPSTPVPQVPTSIDASNLASHVEVVVPDSASTHSGGADSGADSVATPVPTYPAATPDASEQSAVGTVAAVDPGQASLTPAGDSSAAKPRVATTIAPAGTPTPRSSKAAPTATTPTPTVAPTATTAAPTATTAAPTATTEPTATT